VADTTNNLIRQITPTGVVTTIAGVTGVAGSQDGTGGGALFNLPGGLAVENKPSTEAIKYYLYVADTGNSAIRKITPSGVVTTLAGLPTIGGLKDGTGSSAWFNQPKSLTFAVTGAATGDLYVADTGNATIRKVTQQGVVTTLALSAPVPAITTQPSSVTVTTGGSASFSVTATSPSPMTYQWKKDGADLSGATTATYSISTTSSSNAGNYTVFVTNFVGSVTSATAALTVNAAPAPTPTPPPSSGGGGGGGTPSFWFYGVLSLLALARRMFTPRKCSN